MSEGEQANTRSRRTWLAPVLLVTLAALIMGLPTVRGGFVGGVVFPVATVNDSATGRIAIYYGCADTVVGVAYTQVDELIAYIKANS